ncbi:MAG: cytochrome c biogenesis protein [Oligoflexia bacterium]|nr:cytochrome c biogenesis protein [Oligoflexia bacterium]
MALSHSKLSRFESIIAPVNLALIGALLWLVFMVVPNERVMGPVQRIFYFHVGSAIACYIACAVIFFCGIAYLSTRGIKYDILTQAAAEIGFVFCTITLVTGMIWGHAAWNTWFRWEPRLVTFLVLWLILLALNLLRAFGDSTRIPQHAAILGIVSALTVPIVVFSINLVPQFTQLHPQVIGNRGLKDPSFIYTMCMGMAALALLELQLLSLRFRIGLLEHGLEE